MKEFSLIEDVGDEAQRISERVLVIWDVEGA